MQINIFLHEKGREIISANAQSLNSKFFYSYFIFDDRMPVFKELYAGHVEVVTQKVAMF